MLDAYIIEELKRRERESDRDGERRPQLPIPGEDESPDSQPVRQTDEKKPQRDVVIIDYSV
jgi:hypothetical protein